MAFNVIQTFFIDPAAVNQSPTVYLTSATLYFKAKPTATNNKSGCNRPGAVVYICEMKNGKPDYETLYEKTVSALEWDDINVSLEATSPVVFKFKGPTKVSTGKYYGLVVKLEDPDFILWRSKQGEHLVGTNIISPGPSGKTDGYLYTGTNSDVLNEDPSSDLKYKIGIAKFQSSNTVARVVPFEYEFIDYNSLSGKFKEGEWVYQFNGNAAANNYGYKKGTLLINASSNTITGTGTLFDSTIQQNKYIVLSDGTVGNTIVRKVQYVTSNTSLTLDERPNFTNAAGRYWVSPVAHVYYNKYSQNNIILIDSSANSTVRFCNNTVRWGAIANSGSGYTNSDYVTVSGGGSTLNAVANVITDSNGSIKELYWSNNGLGFTTSPTVAITSTNGAITNAATITVNTSMFGALLVGELSEASVNVANITVYPVDQFRPMVYLNLPTDTSANMTHLFTYSSGGNYYTNTTLQESTDLSKVNEIRKYEGIIMSRSLEVMNTSGLYNNDKSAVFTISLATDRSNTNLFLTPAISSKKLDIFTYWNDINNDFTNEHTTAGNAVVKHISTKVNFANNKFAEDIRVFMTCYKPANTDVKVYARIHNSADNESFDDKNWSPLELKDGIGLVSSKTDPQSYVELSFGFPQYPQVNNTLTGLATTTLSSSTLNGTGTDFVTDLAANDLIRIYSPIFPTDSMVAVVNSVVNTTQITLKSTVTNNSVVGVGFKIDKIKFKNVGFNNIQNDNVVRYYSSSMTEFDAYDTMQIKIVLLADSRRLVPRVDDVRVIGVSA